MKKLLLSALTSVALIAAVETALGARLFDAVSYSNSDAIDSQLRERNGSNDWTMVFVGDSEVRWGINPVEVDKAYQSRGLHARTFNHAFDGFGASWWEKVAPALLNHPSMKSVQTVAVGMQLIEPHSVLKVPTDNCGALQRPVITSSFGTDLGLQNLCGNETWDARLGKSTFGFLWSVRYAPAVRTMLMPAFLYSEDKIPLNSASVGPQIRGYQAHSSIADNPAAYEGEFARWAAQYDPVTDFKPLDPDRWSDMTKSGGFFDQLEASITKSGRKLVLFALPTNPSLIDTFHRRDDYLRNSKLLTDWARKHGVRYIDLGIRDGVDRNSNYSDIRHLSGSGADAYSLELGMALAKTEVATR